MTLIEQTTACGWQWVTIISVVAIVACIWTLVCKYLTLKYKTLPELKNKHEKEMKEMSFEQEKGWRQQTLNHEPTKNMHEIEMKKLEISLETKKLDAATIQSFAPTIKKDANSSELSITLPPELIKGLLETLKSHLGHNADYADILASIQQTPRTEKTSDQNK